MIMKTKYIILFTLALFTGTAMCAQQDPMVTQYMFSGHFLNPAYAGSHDYANLTVLGRRQWMGFDGAPFSSFLSFDMPISIKNIGVGGVVMNDNIGVTSRSEVAGTFSYHLKLSDKATLAVGLRAGVTYYRAKLTELQIWDQQDQVFMQNVNGKILPNSGAGIYFYMPRFFAGVSIPNVINYKEGTALALNIAGAPNLERHYYGTAGVVIPAGKNFEIKPSGLVKYVPGAPIEFDANINVLMYKTLWIGGSYRTNDGIQGIIEYQATPKLRIGYAYDIALTDLRRYNSGSHEIMIAWDFIKEEKIRYKSPRFF
jgi:type IX secretion system PorP/SprF family membrane protein